MFQSFILRREAIGIKNASRGLRLTEPLGLENPYKRVLKVVALHFVTERLSRRLTLSARIRLSSFKTANHAPKSLWCLR